MNEFELNIKIYSLKWVIFFLPIFFFSTKQPLNKMVKNIFHEDNYKSNLFTMSLSKLQLRSKVHLHRKKADSDETKTLENLSI
jgi:hypothetical protein